MFIKILVLIALVDLSGHSRIKAANHATLPIQIECEILYLRSTPNNIIHDADAFDDGFINYLDGINGTNSLTIAHTKPDVNGDGLYDPNNTNNPIAIDISDYDLIVISPSTASELAYDLTTMLRQTSAPILNMNHNVIGGLGMMEPGSSSIRLAGGGTDSMFVTNTAAEILYNFPASPNYYPYAISYTQIPHASADQYLWGLPNSQSTNINGSFFYVDQSDPISGANNHGNRVFLGYTYSGLYQVGNNPGPPSSGDWFDPQTHLTAAGLQYLEQAISLLSNDCSNGTISGFVMSDTDGDNTGDDPIQNVTIDLYTSTNSLVASAVSDVTGYYQFFNVVPGSYYLIETDLPGYQDVSDADLSTGGFDPDGADGVVDDRIPVILAINENDEDNNFTEVSLGSISGFVYQDDSGNGLGDTGVGGVTIELRDAVTDVLISSVATNGSGYYVFENQLTGNYTLVQIDIAGYADVSDQDASTDASDPDGADGIVDDKIPVVLEAGEVDSENNFVDVQLGTIQGSVSEDTNGDDLGDNPIQHIIIILENLLNVEISRDTTDQFGNFEFTNVLPGDYNLVEIDSAGFQDVYDSDSSTGGGDLDGNDNVVNDIIPVTVTPGEVDSDNDFIDEQLAGISGSVTLDTDNNGTGDIPFEGIVIELYTLSNVLVAKDTTDASGIFSFANIPPGGYNLVEIDSLGFADIFDADTTPDPDGADGTVDDIIPVNLTAGELDSENSFVEIQLGSITGSVLKDTDGNDSGDAPMEFSTIELRTTTDQLIATVQSNNIGAFDFDLMLPGEYVLVELPIVGYQDINDIDFSPDPDGDDGLVDNRIPVSLIPGEIDADNNFINEELGSISGTVSADTNNDDIGDTPLSNIIIELIDDNSIVIGSTTTVNGAFSFLEIAPGTYILRQTNSLNYQNISDQDSNPDPDGVDGIANDSIPVILDAGENDWGNDFVDEELGSIEGSVFNDTDNNDSGDTPILNALIELRNSLGQPIDTAYTDASGIFIFQGVEPGEYSLRQDASSGVQNISDTDITPDPDGSDNIADNLISVILVSGELDADNNFVDEELGLVSGYVLEDTNNDDLGDNPMVGVQIDIVDLVGTIVATTVTDNNGLYEFLDIAPGNYLIIETDLPNYLDVLDEDQTPDPDGIDGIANDTIPLTLAAAEADTDNIFINEMSGTISGYVLEDIDNNDSGDNPLQNIVVELQDDLSNVIGSTQSDALGYFEFISIAPGNYSLVQTNLLDYIDVSDSDATPDPDGGDIVADGNIAVVLMPGEDDSDNNFIDEQVGTISGFVLSDTDNNDTGDTPLVGVNVSMHTITGTVIQSTTTLADGSYSFTNIAPGNYFIIETDPLGYEDVMDEDQSINGSDLDGADGIANDTIPVILVGAEVDEDNNFIDEQNAIISGFVSSDTDGDGLGDDPMLSVIITLKDLIGNTISNVSTDAIGYYEFPGVSPGEYILIETDPSGYIDVSDVDATPDPDGNDNLVNDTIPVVALAGELDADNNFINEEVAGISGSVLEDTDNDDLGDSPLVGVTIELQTLSGTVIGFDNTATDGTYAFADVPPGSYFLQEVAEPGYADILDEDQSINSGDSDGADGTVDNRIPVILLAGEIDADNNFINEQLMSLGSTVFEDKNGNGLQELEDVGIQGITVDLTTVTGTVLASIVTDVNGFYFFNDITPGEYILQINNPNPNYPTSSPGAGGDDGIDGDDNGIQASSGDVTRSAVILLNPNSEPINESFLGGDQDNTFDNNGDMTIDFGFTGQASIIGTVWFDITGEGIQDLSEPGLENVTVNLLDDIGNFIATTQSGFDGSYLFNDLEPGDYIVEFVTPSAYTEVVPNANGIISETQDCDCPNEDNGDNDADTATGRSHIVKLSSGETEDEVDAGFNLLLGIELIDFTAKYNERNEYVDITWETSAVADIDFFIVERSVDNGDFENIRRISNDASTLHEYEYGIIDEDTKQGLQYQYRLKIVSANGDMIFSTRKIVLLKKYTRGNNKLRLYPNPATDQLLIHINKEQYDELTIDIYDLKGQRIIISSTKIINHGEYAVAQIPIHELVNGTYIAKINLSKVVITKKFTVLK